MPQAWVVLSSDPLSDTALGSDFLVRRARLILTGQVSERVGFFFVTDSPNWGRGGNWTPDFYVLDAFVTFDLGEALKLDAGILLPPFVHHASGTWLRLLLVDAPTYFERSGVVADADLALLRERAEFVSAA